MASLARVGLFIRPILAKRTNLVAPVTRTYAYWNKDWKPGPFPVTPEERRAAAKKYGLREEDYEPYPDEGFGYGDYPQLPAVSENSRSWYQDWDMPEHRSNFLEPIHADADAMKAAWWDPNMKFKYTTGQMLFFFLGGWGLLWILYSASYNYVSFKPSMPKQFPFRENDGRKHYSFEPAD